MPKFEVLVDEDSITIRSTANFGALIPGDEVLHWESAEWEDDPDVVLSIANAIKNAYEDPRGLYTFLISKNII